MTPRIIIGPVLASVIATAGVETVARAEAAPGGQVVLALGGTIGQTYRSIQDGGIALERDAAGRLGGEFGLRFWLGSVVIGGTAALATAPFEPSDSLLLGEAGARIDRGRWRLMALLDYGQHTVDDLGTDFLASPTGPSSTTVACVGPRLSIERRGSTGFGWGFSFFLVRDLQRRDVEVQVSRAWDGEDTEAFRVGGWIGGALLRISLGS